MKFNDLSITFHTDKIRECIEFYEKYFKAKVVFDAEWYVMIRFDSDSPHPLELSFQGGNELQRDIFKGGITINMRIKDVDVCYKQIQSMGVSFFEDITDHEWGDRAFSILDPIGNIVYVYSEREIDDKYKDAVKI